MKKILAFALVFVLAFTVLTGCGKKEEPKETKEPETVEGTENEIETDTEIAKYDGLYAEQVINDIYSLFWGDGEIVAWAYSDIYSEDFGVLSISKGNFSWFVDDERWAKGSIELTYKEDNDLGVDMITFYVSEASFEFDDVGYAGDYAIEIKTILEDEYHVYLVQLNNGDGLFSMTVDNFIPELTRTVEEQYYESPECREDDSFYALIWKSESGIRFYLDDVYIDETEGRFVNSGLNWAIPYEVAEGADIMPLDIMGGPVAVQVTTNAGGEVTSLYDASYIEAPPEELAWYALMEYDIEEGEAFFNGVECLGDSYLRVIVIDDGSDEYPTYGVSNWGIVYKQNYYNGEWTMLEPESYE